MAMPSFKEFVEEEERQEKMLLERSLSHLWRLTERFEWGFVSAERSRGDCGQGREYTPEERKEMTRELGGILAGLPYSYTKMRGGWINDENKQESEATFFVTDVKRRGRLEGTLIKLGREFNQDAVIFSDPAAGLTSGSARFHPYLIGTNDCYHVINKKGKRASDLRNGQKRRMESKIEFGRKGILTTKVNGRPFMIKGAFDWIPEDGGKRQDKNEVRRRESLVEKHMRSADFPWWKNKLLMGRDPRGLVEETWRKYGAI